MCRTFPGASLPARPWNRFSGGSPRPLSSTSGAWRRTGPRRLIPRLRRSESGRARAPSRLAGVLDWRPESRGRYPPIMRAVVVAKQGSPVAPNTRFVTDWPDPPAPSAGQVLIRTLCSAFNQMDLWVGRGVPGLKLEYPRVSGCDACGVVERAGAGVDAAWVGRRVMVNAAVEQPARDHPDDPPGFTP